MAGTGDRIRIRSVELLSDGWTKLKKIVLDYRRRDGVLETHTREVYERGEAATVLPYDPARGTVLLVRQFRLPVYLTSEAEDMLETCAGVLDISGPIGRSDGVGIARLQARQAGAAFRAAALCSAGIEEHGEAGLEHSGVHALRNRQQQPNELRADDETGDGCAAGGQ